MLRVAAILLLLICTPRAMAWGEPGHRVVASVADAGLTPATRREVARLLAGEPEPTLAGVSAWADRLRASDPGLGRRSASWHYVNLGEDACTYDAARDCRRGDCIVAALQRELAVLADRGRGLPARRRALKFVVHFVGDLHQPLHAAYARDKGGNTVQLRLPSAQGERGSNLHAFWDNTLIAGMAADETALLAQVHGLPRAGAPRGAGASDVPSWAEASCRVALTPGFYPATRRPGRDYESRWRPVALAQLRLGGQRLASVLNAALGPRQR